MSNPDISTINVAAIAAAFAAIGEQMLILEGAFRAAAGGAAGAAVDAKAGKPVRSSKSKPAPEPDEAISEDTVREALKGLSDAQGKEAMVAVLAKFGAGRLSEVDESSYGELLTAIKAAEEEEEEAPAPKSKAKAAPAKKAKAKAEPEIDIDDLTEKFKALVEADKAAAKAALKGAGLAKLADLDTDDADAVKELYDAIVAALPEEDDDLLG